MRTRSTAGQRDRLAMIGRLLVLLVACGGGVLIGHTDHGVLDPEVAASASGASECEAARPEWIWCDDFEIDRLPRYFEYDERGGSFTRAAAVGRGGSTGMRAHWQPGQVNAGALHLAFGRVPGPYFRTVDAGTRDYREIHWRFWVRHSRGWSGGGAGKLTRAIVFGTSGWATAIKALVWSGRHADPPGSHPDQHSLMMEPTSGTSPRGELLTTADSDRVHVRWLGSRKGLAQLFAPVRVEAWHCVEVRVRLNASGRSDGIFEVWVDGTMDAKRADLNWVGSYDDFGINAIFLENYWNAGAPAAQERYLDDLVVSTAPIGCGE